MAKEEEVYAGVYSAQMMHDAFEISMRSPCQKMAVGCIVVTSDVVYNSQTKSFMRSGAVTMGATLGTHNKAMSLENKCPGFSVCQGRNGRCCNTIHAEQSVIAQCAKIGMPIHGAILYCTHKPCFTCQKSIEMAGIAVVFYAIEPPYRAGPDEPRMHGPDLVPMIHKPTRS